MPRQSITLTPPNDTWLKNQVQSEEYTSKSDIVNDLIRKARARQEEIEFIRAKLIKSENSGFTAQSSEEILAEFKSKFTP